ncbi:MAG: LPS-assembly protein LptD [Gammaproteobacteria bacterium]|nr:LPS-assembly protein LptD [Gammaproteobacteria bacterium]
MLRKPLTRILPLAVLASLLLATSLSSRAAGLAGADFGLCSEPGSEHSLREILTPIGDENTYLDANESEALQNEIFNFRGDVLIRRSGREMESDSATYNRTQDTVRALGNVRYRQHNLSLLGNSGYFELGNDKGEVETITDFRLPEKHGRGSAASMTFESRDHQRIKQGIYTTCNTGNDDWYLHSSDIRLDQAEGVGAARNVWIEFKGVPIFYSPYMTFPLSNKRKSGFLAPSFITSTETGSDIRVPYYLNIAPERDATVTARNITKRGLQILGEFRYLSPDSHGQLDLGYLPNDSSQNRSRMLVSYRHSGTPAPRWSTDVNFGYVSDKSYFEQLGDTLTIASTTHLERRAETTYREDNWSATGRVQAYQTVDETLPGSSRPYQRLPQLLFSANLPQDTLPKDPLTKNPWGRNAAFSGEYVHFDRTNSLTAQRIDLQPTASLPFSTDAAYLTPTLGVRHTQYLLNGKTAGTAYDTRRTLPTLSLDSGVFFERDADFGERRFTHTLEPRLYYLYVPLQDQSNIPVFDSGAQGFSFANMFQTNRFSGADRVGDANQVTLALTSRLLDGDGGQEKLRASIGQIHYFRDRTVTLPGGAVDTVVNSNIVGELSGNDLVSHWSPSANFLWNRQQRQIDTAAIGMRYRSDEKHLVNLTYRYQRGSLEQTDLSALWPLSRTPQHQWNAVARWNYSLPDRRTLESLAGIEYDTCCWRVRVTNRHFINNTVGGSNSALFLQLELKGLTSFGDKAYRKGLEGLIDSSTFNR